MTFFDCGKTSFCVTINDKGSRPNVNKHELVNGESLSNARDARCLFIVCVIVYNLYYCCYAKTSSKAVFLNYRKDDILLLLI